SSGSFEGFNPNAPGVPIEGIAGATTTNGPGETETPNFGPPIVAATEGPGEFGPPLSAATEPPHGTKRPEDAPICDRLADIQEHSQPGSGKVDFSRSGPAEGGEFPGGRPDFSGPSFGGPGQSQQFPPDEGGGPGHSVVGGGASILTADV